MTASHPRRTAAVAVSFLVLGALTACGNGQTSSNPSSTATKPVNGSAECAAGKPCSTTPITVGETSLTVAAAASRGSQTITAELTAEQQLHCATGVTPGAATATFSNSGADAAKTVTYVLTGAPAAAEAEAYATHPDHLACFGSAKPFVGYVDGRSGEAVLDSESGLYEAALLQCARVDTKPCFRYAASGGTVTLTITTAPGDPKTIG